MDIHEERKDGFLVLGLEGRLDAVSSKMFEEKVLALVDGGERRIVIDLSRLDYVSSAGLRVFLVASKRLIPRGVSLCFAPYRNRSSRSLTSWAFISIFSILNSKDEALNSLR